MLLLSVLKSRFKRHNIYEMNKTEEQKLLEGARDFDNAALAQIYDRYSPGLYQYAMRLLGETQISEDCVAETFSRFLNALQQKSGPREHLQAYLYRIAHNWITDHYRKAPIPPLDIDEQRVVDPGGLPHEELEYKTLTQDIRMAILQLTPEQRQVIVLRYLQDWDYQEIANVLIKTVGAIKALQHRGLENLKNLLESSEINIGGKA
jgi:RNA polymerase sigma-70 factor (ECF subfamily)